MLLSAVFPKLQAQQRLVYPDKVTMIQDPVTSDTGFVFPRLVAEDYLFLLDENKSQKVVIIDQDSLLVVRDSTISNLQKLVENVEEVKEAERKKYNELELLSNAYRDKYKSERRQKRLWQLATLAAIVGIVLK